GDLIADNSGGGLGYDTDGSADIDVINDTIVANEGPGLDGADEGSSRLMLANTIIAGNAPDLTDSVMTCTAVANIVGSMPAFADDQYHLAPGSVAIDAGDNDVVPPSLDTDASGNPRIIDGDGDGYAEVDVGYDEYAPSGAESAAPSGTLPSSCDSGIPQSVSALVAPGQTLATDGGAQPSPDIPLQTAVTVPQAAPPAPATGYDTSIRESNLGTIDAAPVTGWRVAIATDPAGTTADPYHVSFSFDASLLGGARARDIAVSVNGSVVPDCGHTEGAALPDPCVATRTQSGSGGAIVKINATDPTGTWTFTAAQAGVFAIPTADSRPEGITAGPDGNLWFTETNTNKIGQITPTGTITEYTIPTANSQPQGIAAGPDGNLWFTETNTNKIGQITPTGTITEYTIPTANSQPQGIAAGPDGNLWFTERSGNNIGQITPSGTIGEFPIETADSDPYGIAAGPDGNLWFTERGGNKVALISPGMTATSVALSASDPSPHTGDSVTYTAVVSPVPDGGTVEFDQQGQMAPIAGCGAVAVDAVTGKATCTTSYVEAGQVVVTAAYDGDDSFAASDASPKLTVTVSVGSGAAALGALTLFPLATAETSPNEITAGPDGNLWFTEFDADKIGRITPSGTVTEYPIPTADGEPQGITAGPDGNLWFTETNTNQIGQITPTGTITEYTIPTADSYPDDIAAGADGNLWFAEGDANQIAEITPTGTITEYPIPTADSEPEDITAGPDGNLWFTEPDANQIGRITSTGTVTEYAIPTPDTYVEGIVAGPDGNLWFTESDGNKIGEITPSGTITEYPVPTADSSPSEITAGPDGNLWFTEFDADKIGRITPSGAITEYTLPNADAYPEPFGIAAGPDGNIWFTEWYADAIGMVGAGVGAEPKATSVSLSVDSTSVQTGDTVTYTATVSPVPDGGKVEFDQQDPAAPVDGCAAVAVDTTTGKATCRTSYASAGTVTVIATYGGDSGFAASDPSAPATVDIAAPPSLTSQTISFTSPAAMTYGDPDQSLSPSATSDLPVSLAASPAPVCTLVAGRLHATGTGTCAVTAAQAGNEEYAAAASVTRSVTIAKAMLVVTAGDATMTSGAQLPGVTPSYSGFVDGDTASVLDTVPTCRADVTTGTTICSGGADADYAFTYRPGTLTVLPAPAPPTAPAAPTTSTPPTAPAAPTTSAPPTAPSPPIVPASSTQPDITEPTIRAQVSSSTAIDHGWYRSAVHVTFSCVAGSAPIIGGCPHAVVLARSGKNQTVVRTIGAGDGGSATVRVSGIDIDRVAPTLQVTGARSGHAYSGRRRLRCLAHDGLSGVASCQLSQRTKKLRGGSGIRVVRYVATATDRAGNSRRTSGSYRIER
ncbi:MAG: virginiamycin B lyase family protein, partial [Solirubrobacteraceae bacterium]